jgi:hypothetical protein
MEKQTLAMPGRSRPVRSVVVAILLAGLLGIVPYLAQPQYQTEVATGWSKFYNQSVWPV